MQASVIVPVLNEGERLTRCVEALARQRGVDSFEVLVVDGGSTDGSLERLERGIATVLRAPGSGVSSARNLGARRARGRVLAFTDGDCLPQPDWLATLLDAVVPSNVGGAGGALRHRPGGLPSVAEDLETAALYRGFITSNVAYRGDVFARVGGFDPELRCAEDWDLAWRVQRAGYAMAFAPGALVVHDPPENARYASHLRKQFWYGRHDLPALLKHAGAPLDSPPRRAARSFLRSSVLDAAAVSLLASIVAAPAGLALLLGSALRRAQAVASARAEARDHVPHLVAHFALKSLARGAGTLRGISDLARRGGRNDGTVPRGPGSSLKWGKRSNVRA